MCTLQSVCLSAQLFVKIGTSIIIAIKGSQLDGRIFIYHYHIRITFVGKLVRSWIRLPGNPTKMKFNGI